MIWFSQCKAILTIDLGCPNLNHMVIEGCIVNHTLLQVRFTQKQPITPFKGLVDNSISWLFNT